MFETTILEPSTHQDRSSNSISASGDTILVCQFFSFLLHHSSGISHMMIFTGHSSPEIVQS